MKRILCMLLAVMLVLSAFTFAVYAEGESDIISGLATSDEATADEATADEATADEATADEPEEELILPTEPKPEGTNRYYFYLPDEWVNDYAFTAGIYWWEGSIGGEYWPGNMAKSAGVEGVYYYDIATDTPTIIWNNYLDGGMDSYADIYRCALQTIDISVSGANYDGMIFVVSLDKEFINSFNNKVTYGGEWYYYYGSGKYGKAPTIAEAQEIFTNKSFGQWATPDETPTEPEVPTNPVRPTNPVVTPTEPDPIVTEPTEPTEVTVSTEPVETTVPEETTKATEPTETTVPEVITKLYLMGDADLNGKVNVRDVTTIQKHVARILTLTDDALVTSDVNEDLKLNVKDATVIQKYLAKIKVEFVIGEKVEKEIKP